MYYFNIQDILKEHKELTKAQIYIEHKKIYGFVNRNSLVKALNKLVKHEKIISKKRTIPNKRGVYYFYSLKK